MITGGSSLEKKNSTGVFFSSEFVRLLPRHITITRICILAYFLDKIQESCLLLLSQTLQRITPLLFRQTLRISYLVLRKTWFAEDCIFFQWDNIYRGLRPYYWVKLALPRIVKLTYIYRNSIHFTSKHFLFNAKPALNYELRYWLGKLIENLDFN